MKILDSENFAGAPFFSRQTRIVPFAQTVRVSIPRAGGLVWSRPTAILVQTSEGNETVLPIVDVTRQAQLTFLGLGFLGAIIIWLIYRKKGDTL